MRFSKTYDFTVSRGFLLRPYLLFGCDCPASKYWMVTDFRIFRYRVECGPYILHLMFLCYEIYGTAQKANTATYKFTTRNHHHL